MTAGLISTDPGALGSYRLLGRLGGGGMGQVFLARSPGGRPAAVKVIRPELAADPEFRARFTREVAAARKVSGLFTAVVIDADTDGPVPWLATAYIAGPPLSAAIRDMGPLPAASLLALAAGLVEALQAIHAAGVVHRDLKPSNVLISHDGPRVIDFGISHALEASALTATGTILGTPGYMSPEQAQGHRVGPASDVFSLGAVLTYAATGAGPFGDGPTAALVYRVVNAEPDLDRVPEELRPLIGRCLAKDPHVRPALEDLIAELGGELISENWLPPAVTSAFPDYAPSARIAALPQPGPGPGQPGRALPDRPPADIASTQDRAPRDAPSQAPAPEASWPALGSPPVGPLETPARQAPAREPSRPGHRTGGRRWRVKRWQLAAIIAVVVVAGLATWLAPGTGGSGHAAGQPAPALRTASAGSSPTAAGSGQNGAAGDRGAVSGPAASRTPTPGATPTRGTTTAPTGQALPPPASSAGSVQSPAAPGRATPSPGQSSTTASSPQTSTTGPLTAVNAKTYTCSDFPSQASSTQVSYPVINNTSSQLAIYGVVSGDASGFVSGFHGYAAPDATTTGTLAAGGVYLVYNGGQCIGAFKVTGSGNVTVS